jgi:hypothetical protein
VPTRGELVVERKAFPGREGEGHGSAGARSERRVQLELNPLRPVVLSLEDVSDLSPGLYSASFRPETREHAVRVGGFVVLEEQPSG